MKKLFFVLFFLFSFSISVRSQCVSGCNSNTGVNASNTNIATIEYDNIVGAYHSSIVKEDNGVVKAWGEYIQPDGTSHQTTPIVLSPANGYNYTGSILKFTGGGDNDNQFALLTTAGLYVWGHAGDLVSTTIKSTTAFGAVAIGTFGVAGTKADGLPAGVSPSNVKMLFGSNQTLGIVTCDGQAWVLSTNGNNYGDAATDNSTNDIVWHRVKTNATTNLTNVVAMRGNGRAMIALTSSGALYTWGTGTYLGNASAATSRTFATLMNTPLDGATSITPKMIGITVENNSSIYYYVLGTNGKLYSTGAATANFLGRSTTSNTSWLPVRLGGTGVELTNLAWFSPQEHDVNVAAVNALTYDGKLYNWGNNDFDMLGGTTSSYSPRLVNGISGIGIAANDVFFMTETGGHTTMVLKECEKNFGYAGHAENGSMANGSTAATSNSVFTYSTAEINLCGAATTPTLTPILKICPENTANLADAYIGSASLAPDVKWYNGIPGASGTTLVSNPASVGPGTYYATYGTCTNAYNSVVVSYYIPGEAGSNSCLDTDGDGVSNLNDHDDDNDGILDAVESAGCFYSSTDAHTVLSVISPYNGGSGDPAAGNDIETLYNLNTTDGTPYPLSPFNFAGSQTITPGSAIFSWSYPTRILLTSLAVSQNTNGMVSTTSRYGVLYGSNDGINYVPISATAGVTLHNPTVTFTVTSTTPYRYYQIRYIGTASGGNSTNGTLGTADIFEIQPTYNTTGYVPSANPRPEACLSDTDNDGIVNYLDNDSDGDLCFDAREGDENVLVTNIDGNGRITGGVDANGVPNLVNTGGTADVGGDLGQGIGDAYNKVINECGFPDSDGDGITDNLDLDDDNDGILDTDEGFCASNSVYTMNLSTTLTNINTSFGTDGKTFNLVYDLTSGTAVSGLGTTFNVPFTYSDFNNTATAVNHTWASALISGTEIRILPNTNSLYTGLPSNNLQTEYVNGSGSTNNTDTFMRWLLQTSYIDQLGTFTTSMGNLPNVTGQLSSFSTQTTPFINSLMNYEEIVGQPGRISSAYYARIIDLPLYNVNQYTDFHRTRYGTTQNWIYTAFDNPNDASNATNAGNRGLISIFRNTVTYCNHRDTDNDGTPDYLDLDSDGDGCPDAVEGDENVLASNLSSGRITGTVNANGVPNLVNASGGADVGGDEGQGIGQAFINNPAAVGGTVSSNQSIFTGDTPATLNLTGHSGNIQWQVSTDNVTFTNISGANSASYSPGALTVTTYYRTVTTSVGGCTATSSTVVTITVCGAGSTAPGFNNFDNANYSYFQVSGVNSYNIKCASSSQNADLSLLVPSSALPSGTIVTWHTATPATTANRISSITNVAGATVKVYAAFYHAGSDCYSPTREVVIYAPICGADDDYSATPIIFGVGGTLPSIYQNDTYKGVIISTLPANSVGFTYSSWVPANGSVNPSNGVLTIPATTLPGTYTYIYQITDTDPDGVPNSNMSFGTVTFKVISCTNSFNASPATDFTQTGVSNLEGFGTTGTGWPQNVPNGFIAIESKNKGFVITRVNGTAAITSPVEGMLVYDDAVGAKCVKLYYDGSWHCLAKSCL